MSGPAGNAGTYPSLPGAAVTVLVSAGGCSPARKRCGTSAKTLLILVSMVLPSAAMCAAQYDSNPDALRDALVEAAAHDPALLEVLCRRYKSTIVNNFESWRRVPAAIRGDDEQVRRYGDALSAIAARIETHGDRTLVGILEGRAEKTRIMNWGRTYNDAEVLVDQDRCAEAIAMLEPIVDDTPDWAGTAIEPLAPRVHGILGLCHSRLGDQESALKWTYSAYELCVARKDPDGIIAYSGNMAEIFRKVGDYARFRDWLDATIEAMESAGRHEEARTLRERHAPAP